MTAAAGIGLAGVAAAAVVGGVMAVDRFVKKDVDDAIDA